MLSFSVYSTLFLFIRQVGVLPVNQWCRDALCKEINNLNRRNNIEILMISAHRNLCRLCHLQAHGKKSRLLGGKTTITEDLSWRAVCRVTCSHGSESTLVVANTQSCDELLTLYVIWLFLFVCIYYWGGN